MSNWGGLWGLHEGFQMQRAYEQSNARLAMPSYITDDWRKWQQGDCLEYAHALKQKYPHLGIGALVEHDGPYTREQHFFAHDDTHAYDSAGRHPLPYRGVDGGYDMQLGTDLDDFDDPDPDLVAEAHQHIDRHGIGPRTAHRTAMPAPMPEGITFHYHELNWQDPQHRPGVCDSCSGGSCKSADILHPHANPPLVQAVDKDGNYVGHLDIGWELPYEEDDPRYSEDDEYLNVPDNIHVDPKYRRQNVATGMFDFAKGIFPELQHSRHLSELGKLWSGHEQSRHAHRLAMPAPMPEGITFHYHPTNDTIPTKPWPPDPDIYAPSFSAPAVEARHNGKTVGFLEWDPPLHSTTIDGVQYGDYPPEISMIKVHRDYRRHGVATAMFDFARRHQGDLSHSPEKTAQGEAWAGYEQSRHARLAMAWDEWAPRIEHHEDTAKDVIGTSWPSSSGTYLVRHPEIDDRPSPGFGIHQWSQNIGAHSGLAYTINPKENYLHINLISTHPNHRKDGLAEAMLRRMLDDHPGMRINPGFMTDMGRGLKDGLTKRIPEARDVLARLAMAWDEWAPQVQGGCGHGCDHSRMTMGEYSIQHPYGRSALQFTHDTAPDGTPELYISGVHTNEGHRRSGVAEALMRRLHDDHPGTRINPGYMTDMGQGLKDGLSQRIPGAGDVLARIAAVTGDLVDRLNDEYHQWYDQNSHALPPNPYAWRYQEEEQRGPLGYWPHIESFLEERYPAAHQGFRMGLEDAQAALDDKDADSNRGREDDPLKWLKGRRYESGPEAVARHGYDPSEIAAGMVLLHNQTHPGRGSMAERDQQRLVDIYTKRRQMQRDYEQREKEQQRTATRRLSALAKDFVDGLRSQFAEWNGGSHHDLGHWPIIEDFLRDNYPAASRDIGFGLEEARPLLRGEQFFYDGDNDYSDLKPYETGPEAEATHGYDPKAVAAGMVYLHNETNNRRYPGSRDDSLAEDEDFLTDIFQKRRQMQRDWEKRNRTAGRSGGGDCYQAAGRYILDNPTADVRLAHGDVDGRGAIAGTRMGHAWIEDGDEVIDPSNGREVRLPRHVYYALGNIGNVARYTPSEAMARMAETEHFGPWHETWAAHTGDAAVVDHGTEWDDPEDEPWDADNDWIGSGAWDDDHREASRRTAAGPDPFDAQRRALGHLLHLQQYGNTGVHPEIGGFDPGETVATHPAAHHPLMTNHWAAEVMHPQPVSGPFGRRVQGSTGRYVNALIGVHQNGPQHDGGGTGRRLEDASNELRVELQHSDHISVPDLSEFSPLVVPGHANLLAAVNPRFDHGLPGNNSAARAAYQTNCQRAVLALDARHRGLNVEARPNFHEPGNPLSDEQWTDGDLADFWRDGKNHPATWIDAEDHFQFTPPGPGWWDAMNEEIASWGPQARALVAVTQADPNNPGVPARHVIYAHGSRGGKVNYADPQIAKADASDWRDRVLYGGHPLLFTTRERDEATARTNNPHARKIVRNRMYSPLRFMRIDDKNLDPRAARHLVDRGTAGHRPIVPWPASSMIVQ